MSEKDDFGQEKEEEILPEDEYGCNDTEIDHTVTLGQNLKRLRETCGIITQAKLQELTGIDKRRISKIENDKAIPTIKEMEKLRKYLGFSYEKLVTRTDVKYVGFTVNMGLSGTAMSWLRHAVLNEEGQKRISTLNLLFSNPGMLEELLDEIDKYVYASWCAHGYTDNAGEFHTLPQSFLIDALKDASIKNIKLALEAYHDIRPIMTSKEAEAAEILNKDQYQKVIEEITLRHERIKKKAIRARNKAKKEKQAIEQEQDVEP